MSTSFTKQNKDLIESGMVSYAANELVRIQMETANECIESEIEKFDSASVSNLKQCLEGYKTDEDREHRAHEILNEAHRLADFALLQLHRYMR